MLLVLAQFARAQSGNTTPTTSFGLTVGLMLASPVGFSADQICPSRVAVSLAASVTALVWRRVFVEAQSGIQQGPGRSCLDIARPARPVGPDTLTFAFYDGRYTQQGYLTVGAHLGVEPISTSSTRIRLFGGVERFIQQALFAPMAGLTLSLGTQPSVRIEAQRIWVRVRQTTEQDFFEDGRLVARQTEFHKVDSQPVTVRVGIELSR